VGSIVVQDVGRREFPGGQAGKGILFSVGGSSDSSLVQPFFHRGMVVLFLSFAIQAFMPSVQAVQFEVVGHETYSIYAQGNVPKTLERDFRISIVDGQWLVEMSGKELETNGVKNVVYATDETNIYQIVRLNEGFEGPFVSLPNTNLSASQFTNLDLSRRFQTSKTLSNAPPYGKYGENGEISRGVVPADNMFLASCPWLAYASSSYLSGVTNNMLEPVWVTVHPPDELIAYSCELSRFDDVLKLPRKITYYSDGTAFTKVDNQYIKLKHPPSDQERFVTAIYEVEDSTNCFGVNVPLKAKLTRFVRKGKAAADLAILTSYEMQTERIDPQSSVTNFLPMPARNAIISDRRFAPIGPEYIESVVYRMDSTIPRWLTMDEVRKTKAYEQAKLQPVRFGRVALDEGWSPKRAVFAVLFFIPTMGVVIALVLKNRPKQTNKQTTAT
jgi:hypothetical protein